MSDRFEVRAWLDEARHLATVQMELGGEALAHGKFEASELDGLISLLSQIREQMAEQVPMEIDPGTRMLALLDPAWKHPGEALPEGKPLHLRHPGLGWLTFVFPLHEARAIAEWLVRDNPPAQ